MFHWLNSSFFTVLYKTISICSTWYHLKSSLKSLHDVYFDFLHLLFFNSSVKFNIRLLLCNSWVTHGVFCFPVFVISTFTCGIFTYAI